MNADQVSTPHMDGIIIGLIQNNLSNGEVRAVLGCGTSRVTRLRNFLKHPESAMKPRAKPKHAVNQSDLDNIKRHLESFDTEDGYSCPSQTDKLLLQFRLHVEKDIPVIRGGYDILCAG